MKINFVIFNKEFYLTADSFWHMIDEDGDFFFSFNLVDLGCWASGIGLTLFNFRISIGWY